MTYRLLPNFGTDDDIIRAHVATTFVHWLPGLRGTGYEIAHVTNLSNLSQLQRRCLAQLPVPAGPGYVECIMIRYPDGSSIPTHTDLERPSSVPLKHHRLFMLVQPATEGGVLSIDGAIVPLNERDAVIFDPCTVQHEVSKVTGVRLMFTVGVWSLLAGA